MSSRAETEWGMWSHRILDLLQVSQNQLLRGYTLPRPWFLVPREGELSEEEARELFAVVRERLLGPALSTPSPIVVRRRIDRIRAAESLPLLYAMRHVARFRGRLGNYWPAFREDILASRMDLYHVQISLAGSLAEVWIRTHEYTQGALYYPRAGAMRIKWPLAHAGLLKADEELLESIGVVLAGESGDEAAAAPLGPEDLDEFLASALRWLQQDWHRHDVRLAKLLRQTDGTQRTIAELAQRWLLENWERVVDARRHGRERPPRSGAATLRAYLRYDAAENRLFAVLPSSAWPGLVRAKVLWGDQEVVVPPRFVEADNETRFDAVNLPVSETLPQGETWFIVGGERRPLRVPPLPQDRGIVFEIGEGKATNRWRAGEAYYVLLPEGDVDKDAADELFDDWAAVGPPEGIERREVLWVRTKDPLGDGIAENVGVLSLAADTLGLPEIEDLWRPRVRLVGGTRAVGSREEEFARDDPPWLEVRGLWEDALPVRLARWDAGKGDYRGEAELGLPVSRSGETRLIELWDRNWRAPAARYRLEVGSLFRIFFEVGTPPIPSEQARFRVALEAHLADGALLREGVTRRELEHVTLVGRAWPGAELTLRVLGGGGWSRILPAQADEGGEWRARWRDLGLRAPRTGALELFFSWRGLVEDRLTAADAPYVAAENLTVTWQGHGSERSLFVSAVVTGAEQHRRAEVVVVGSRPWKDQLWTQAVDLDQGGSFETTLRIGDGDARWLLVLPESSDQSTAEAPWLAYHLPTDPVRGPRLGRHHFSELTGQRHAQWKGIASRLRGTSLPVGLERVLDISALADYVLDVPSMRPSSPKWSEVQGPVELRSFLGRAAPGGEVSVAVFYRVQLGLAGYAGDLIPPYLVAEAETLARAAQSEGGTADLFCAVPDGSFRKLPSSLEIARDEEGWAFLLQAREELRACPVCGVILPPGEAWNHNSPCEAVPCYSHGKRFILLCDGKTLPVHLLVRRDPGDVLPRVQELLRKVARGEDADLPPYVHPWLDELQQVYDDEKTDQEPTDWLLSLVSLPRRIEKVRRRIESGGYAEENELVELGRQVRRYRPALDVLYRWLQSEMG